jgi:hypothetical protein
MRYLIIIGLFLFSLNGTARQHMQILEASSVVELPNTEGAAVKQISTFLLVAKVDGIELIGFALNKTQNLVLHQDDTLRIQISTFDEYFEGEPSYYGNNKRPTRTTTIYVNNLPITCKVPVGLTNDNINGDEPVALLHYNFRNRAHFFEVVAFLSQQIIAYP